MDKLFEIQKIILGEFKKIPFYERSFFNQVTLDNKISGILGSKGIGKTTLLLKKALERGAEDNRALYVSADHIFFLENKILDLVDYLYKETNVNFLCIDEVHKYPNWKQELKNIADIYRNFKIFFSGSSAIDLIQGKYDLSRRVTLYTLHGLSFREYLEYQHGIKFDPFSLQQIVENSQLISQKINLPEILKYFKEYLRTGYYPFFKEFTYDLEKFQAVENATQKTIFEDIASLHSLKTPTLLIIEKLFKYILNSSPGELSAYKLSNALSRDFESISTYLNFLREAQLTRFLYPKSTGKSFLRNPAKMYPENTNLMYANFLPQTQDLIIGKVRETFLINQLQNANIPVFYSPIGDFKVENYTFEVCGKNKTKKQIKDQERSYILADGILIGSKTTIPLYLLGFLY